MLRKKRLHRKTIFWDFKTSPRFILPKYMYIALFCWNTELNRLFHLGDQFDKKLLHRPENGGITLRVEWAQQYLCYWAVMIYTKILKKRKNQTFEEVWQSRLHVAKWSSGHCYTSNKCRKFDLMKKCFVIMEKINFQIFKFLKFLKISRKSQHFRKSENFEHT